MCYFISKKEKLEGQKRMQLQFLKINFFTLEYILKSLNPLTSM
jgi:hypothetical protein